MSVRSAMMVEARKVYRRTSMRSSQDLRAGG